METTEIFKTYLEAANGAFQQLSAGKGKERHAEVDELFENQIICDVNRRLGGDVENGALFQAVKKIYESKRLPTERAIHELEGAVNYVLAAIVLKKEQLEKEKQVVKTTIA